TAAYFIEAKSTFFGLAVFAGTGMGVVQAASRAMMASLIPKGREAEMFGFYAFCGKSSSILGPLIFGIISVYCNQRVALLSVIPFFFVGFILLQRVKAPRPGQASA
ncbi:MAG: MFS transporter, partial [Acidobacteriota bacterium]